MGGGGTVGSGWEEFEGGYTTTLDITSAIRTVSSKPVAEDEPLWVNLWGK